ncbi:phage major capsid protein, P2 family [Vibrio jasicida]|uniref:phage major capsid protein, P2 family n=1 Tax=Vibrio jasicida TaxID=766224 RepID=UPI00069720F8|nr:phage major capsid protein, P2 family [Vibrio jasicida]
MSKFRSAECEKAVFSFLERTKQAYNVTGDGVYFSVTGPKETKLKDAIMFESDFLQSINVIEVDQIVGQAVTVGEDHIATGRTDEIDARFAGNGVTVDGYEYRLEETDTVVFISWMRLAEWANAGKQKEFEKKLLAYVNKQIAADMQRVGWNGLAAAKKTDPKKYPLGQDVNEGWHARMRRIAPKQVVGGNEGDPEIYFDPDGTMGADGGKLYTYKTLDAMGSDLANAYLAPEFIEAPGMVFIIGRELMAAAQYRLYDGADKPSEKNEAQLLSKTIAGRPAYVVPYFPGRRMVLTPLKNLSIYTQRGTKRRKAKDNDDKGRLESWYWRMEGYMVEEPLAYAAFDECSVVIGPRKDPEPEITVPLADKTVAKGTDAEFTVTASNTTKYEWRLNGRPVGDNANTLTLSTADLDAGMYTVEVHCLGVGCKESRAKLTITA